MGLVSRSADDDSADTPALRAAIAEYLALSRSPLRVTAPEWYDAVEPIAWEAMIRARARRQKTGTGTRVLGASTGPLSAATRRERYL